MGVVFDMSIKEKAGRSEKTDKRIKGGTGAAILALSGLAAGILNGLLGAGGGIVMTFALDAVLSRAGATKRDVFANVIAAMLPISFVSTLIYASHGNIDAGKFEMFLIPAILGGAIGAFLLSRISTTGLGRIFSLLVIWSGIYMIIG